MCFRIFVLGSWAQTPTAKCLGVVGGLSPNSDKELHFASGVGLPQTLARLLCVIEGRSSCKPRALAKAGVGAPLNCMTHLKVFTARLLDNLAMWLTTVKAQMSVA